MKFFKTLLKWVFYILLLPFSYLVVSLILTFISVNNHQKDEIKSHGIYLDTNGIHLNIVFPIDLMDDELKKGLNYSATDRYLSFGWGEENFYINTPEWSDLTLKNALHALFFDSSSLVHVNRHKMKQSDWVEVKLSQFQLDKINTYLLQTFKTNQDGRKMMLVGKGYTSTDDFYKADGNYTLFNTCNTWVNTGFKESGLKACLWTPFDFGLIAKYK